MLRLSHRIVKILTMPDRTVFTVLEETAAKYAAAAALHQPIGNKQDRRYRAYSWNEWLESSREIALGLRSLGLTKGEIVCILSETRAEFYLADLGVMGAGGVAAALYTAYPVADQARTILTLGPRFLFIEESGTLSELAQNCRLPDHVILLTGEQDGALSLDALRNLGRDVMKRDPAAFSRIQQELSPKDSAILYLTSGATGEPKMGLSSHAAILANIDMAPQVLPIRPEDSTLVFLPSAHIAQRIVLELVPMRMGTPMWFSESLARLPTELKTIRPTLFVAPPRVWERMYASILNELRKRPAFARKLFERALELGMRAARYRTAGQAAPAWMRLPLKIVGKLVFSKIRERLGGKIRIAASGAAPLARELAEFYAAINMPLIEGYGLTEAGVICLNPLDRPKPGSIGRVLPEIEIRLAQDGELQVRTPCIFKGYYRDEAATRSVLSEDGWFATGDIAEVDSEGYVYITGRKKEVIVSSSGKKVYPARIESLFKTEPIISQVLLIGDKQPYVTALVTLNTAQLDSLNGTELAQAVQDVIARVNKQLADFERIRRFKVLDREFSIEHGELTPTMKIRRSRVLENHGSLVSELYLGKEAIAE
jgi:long-chain acyl-CoA synthetase